MFVTLSTDVTLQFIAKDIKGIDIKAPPSDQADFKSGYKGVLVFLPERRAELDLVRRFYPSGLLREFRTRKGEMLFIAYEIDG